MNVAPTELSGLPSGWWIRTLTVAAIVLGVVWVWRMAQLPGREIVVAATLGFGIPLGARYGKTGRVLGDGLRSTLLVGVVATGAFYAIQSINP